eukprot:CAMPEP_0185270046 /NCGR_PEP_ID=MMETSP1359-20130426/41372_1 /TAXON_ID=552665 /ORGANISM="Bigelowiella longifila, Strain CCMP242" /LENGTH=208 /DNA_ID=CAMNT_0027861465 /DNA_START=205 /DNA_END=827 /DNA_ORIENTATION=-
MPILILVASLCPEGVKGSVYAAVTSVQIAGGTISGSLSASLIEVLNITLSNYDNLWKLVVICSFLRLLVIPLVLLLPTQLSSSTSGVGEEDDERGEVADTEGNGVTDIEMTSVAASCEDERYHHYDNSNSSHTLSIESKQRNVMTSGPAVVSMVNRDKDPYSSQMISAEHDTVPSSENARDAGSTSVCGGVVLIAMLVIGVGWGIGQA